jgi:hypothetical protein
MRSNSMMRAARPVHYSDPVSTPPVIINSRPPRQADIVPAPRPAPVPAPPREFPRLADYLRAVARAAAGEGVDSRLQRAPTGLSEGVPADGGFLVPEVFADDFIGSLYKTGQIAGRCDRKTTTRPLADVELPAIDETSRADGSRFGGVLAYGRAERRALARRPRAWRPRINRCLASFRWWHSRSR